MTTEMDLYDAMHPRCRAALSAAPFDFNLASMPKTAVNYAIGAPRPSPGRFVALARARDRGRAGEGTMNRADIKARRLRKFRAQDGLCYWCKRPMTLKLKPNGKPPDNYASFEHLVRRREGGYCMPHNTVLACKSCNTEREHGIQTHLLQQAAE